jgi:hypothetical protein
VEGAVLRLEKSGAEDNGFLSFVWLTGVEKNKAFFNLF